MLRTCKVGICNMSDEVLKGTIGCFVVERFVACHVRIIYKSLKNPVNLLINNLAY